MTFARYPTPTPSVESPVTHVSVFWQRGCHVTFWQRGCHVIFWQRGCQMST
jgi:hypothetical protein